MAEDLQKLIDENRRILGDPQLFESMAKNPIFWKRFLIKTLPQGRGSTLDADTVDGYHADDFLQRIAAKHLAMGGGITLAEVLAQAEIASAILLKHDGPIQDNTLASHKTAATIDHPDSSIPPAKLSFGTWEKIAEVNITVACDHVDFTGLDINTDGFYMLFVTINPIVQGLIYIYVEGDYVNANYYTQYFYAQATGHAGARSNYPYFASLLAGQPFSSMVMINRDALGYFRFSTQESERIGSQVLFYNFVGCKTATLANITSLRIAAGAAGEIGAGSRFILCRVRTK